MGYINPPFPTLLSHQTGLSVTTSAGATWYGIGSSVTFPRNGIACISMVGHVSGSEGTIRIWFDHNGTSYAFGSTNNSIFGDTESSASGGPWFYISGTSPGVLYTLGLVGTNTTNLIGNLILTFIVSEGDSISFNVANNTGGDTTYIDDLMVMLI